MTNRIEIQTNSVRFDTSRALYGLFFEDINHAADGGIYPEMLRNRAFEDSLVPDGCKADDKQKIYLNEGGWPGAFNHGEGMDEWASAVQPTTVPAWYAKDADFSLEYQDTLNQHRKAALRVRFLPQGSIQNIGYFGMPVCMGQCYKFCCFLKSRTDCMLTLSLMGKDAKTKLGEAEFAVKAAESYVRYDVELKATRTDYDGLFEIACDRKADMLFGFTSLLPEETFCGHGLRKDLAQALKDTHASFIRFPGGCVVEGINEENALSFHRMIGPVYERPSCQLMWHYRTTNSFGFHEFLQLCEDLNMDALYVVNCGMSCQARHGRGFDKQKTEAYLQDALDALEYALGSETTFYGSMRKKAGHPKPFCLKYVEIGNENNGPEYFERYQKFYHTLKKAYPQIIYIANSHTEEQGLPTQMVDEHYYSTPEFFQESGSLFDHYNRQGPEIFLGEYAVNGGNTIASMECALAEAVFLTGVEKNQDIIRMTAYAPLFQNSCYTAWKPNLIVFNSHMVYGIPSYHVISLLGKYRGEKVVSLKNESEQKPPVYCGIPGIQCEKEGLLFCNPKVNGKAVEVSKEIYGEVIRCDATGNTEQGDGQTGLCTVYQMRQGNKKHHYTGKSPEWNAAFEQFRGEWSLRGQPYAWVAFGSEERNEVTFEIDLKFSHDNPVTLSVWNHHMDTDVGCNEPKDTEWNLYSVSNRVWRIADGKSTTRIPWLYDPPLRSEEIIPVQIDYDRFNHYEIRCSLSGYSCYMNGHLVQEQRYPLHPVLSASCEASEENIYLKLVNVDDEEKTVAISLDCDIESTIHTEIVQALPDCINTFEHPLAVSAHPGSIRCTGRELIHHVPAYSVSVLAMTKANEKKAPS